MADIIVWDFALHFSLLSSKRVTLSIKHNLLKWQNIDAHVTISYTSIILYINDIYDFI